MRRGAVWPSATSLLASCPCTVARVATKADPEFLDEEDVVAGALAEAVDQRGDQVVDAFSAALAVATGVAIAQRLQEAADTARTTFIGAFDQAESRVRGGITGAIDRGAAMGAISADFLVEHPSRIRVEQGILSATRYYTNEFFNSQVVPALFDKVDTLLSTPGAQVRVDDLIETLNVRLRSTPYWRVVANAATSRGFHYGVLKAAQQIGEQHLLFRAVIDQRTSAVCDELDGTMFSVARGVDLVERVAFDDDPAAAQRLTPWVGIEDVRGKSAAELEDMGVMVPPLHGNCRSSLVFL